MAEQLATFSLKACSCCVRKTCYTCFDLSIARFFDPREWKANMKRASIYSWALLLNCFIEGLTVSLAAFGNIILNFALLYKYDVSYSSLVESLTVFFAGFIFILFAYDGILKENEYQLVAMFFVAWLLTGMTMVFMLSRFWSVLYDLYLFEQDMVDSFGTLFVVLIPSYIVFMCQFIFLVLFFPVYKSFGWKIFDRVGTNKETIRCYKYYSVYVTFLKGDAIFTVFSFIYYFCFCSLYVLDDFIYPILVILNLFASRFALKLGAQRESVLIQLGYLAFCTILPLYCAFRVLIMMPMTALGYSVFPPLLFQLTLFKSPPLYWRGMYHIQQPMTNLILIGISIVTILVRCILIGLGWFVLINFGGGLREVFKNMSKSKKRAKPKKRKNVSIGDMLAN